MVLRKLLASSTFAIAKTLRNLADRLENTRKELSLFDDEDLEDVEGYEDELLENSDDSETNPVAKRDFDPVEFKKERDDLYRFAELASKIAHNAKGEALLDALNVAFQKAKELGAKRKAVIFTESRETQNYLYRFLTENGYANQIVTINGSNRDRLHNQIYEAWLKKNSSGDRVSGSRDVDVKAALVDFFKDSATILIATEAAAEGVNLQFCSLVVNYDLPWNPQRIEQRIGRCHRYGQKHDVVVVNFVNRRNEADKRVYELLSEKFKLFEGVLGASDEILGALQSGVDIEKRIAAVYQNCRTEEEIKQAFDALQNELDDKIKARMISTRKALIENFDEEVRERLRFSGEQTRDCLSKQERLLLDLTKTELGDRAVFSPSSLRFEYLDGTQDNRFFNFDWKDAEKRGEIFYRRDCPLAQLVIKRALSRKLSKESLTFDYTNYPSIVSVVKPLVGISGWLSLSRLTIDSVDRDEFLIFAAITDAGKILDGDICQKLFSLPAFVKNCDLSIPDDLDSIRDDAIKEKVGEIQTRNAKFLDEETIKIDRWSEDLKLSLERELKDFDDAIKGMKRESSLAQTLEEKLSCQRKIRDLERLRNQKRRDLFDAQDALDQKRDDLIASFENQLKQKIDYQTVFTIRWSVK